MAGGCLIWCIRHGSDCNLTSFSGNEDGGLKMIKSRDYMTSKTLSVVLDEPTKASEPTARPTKVGFVSLGCPKNLVDSEVMMGMLAEAGAELISRAEDADVIVVNTCSLIDSTQQESVNTILEMARHKTVGGARKLVGAGCLVGRFSGW